MGFEVRYTILKAHDSSVDVLDVDLLSAIAVLTSATVADVQINAHAEWRDDNHRNNQNRFEAIAVHSSPMEN